MLDNANKKSDIRLGVTLAEIADLLKDERSVALTDNNVYSLYGQLFQGARVIRVRPGEDSKTLTTLEAVLRDMAAARLDRKGKMITVGGGVVGDLGGFAAAVYMRGIEWINVPTTLLAQVDSSVGGKTAVDLDGYKNMVGAFHLPAVVAICPDFIKTLPEREIECGLGEAFKCALLDRECAQAFQSYQKDGEVSKLVSPCASFKRRVTEADFQESGLRKILNLGHTLGHAAEYLDGHRLSHGEYVTAGLIMEGGAALVRGRISRAGYDKIAAYALSRPKIRQLIDGLTAEALAAVSGADKKNDGGKISVVISDDFRQNEYYYTESQLAEDLNKWKSGL